MSKRPSKDGPGKYTIVASVMCFDKEGNAVRKQKYAAYIGGDGRVLAWNSDYTKALRFTKDEAEATLSWHVEHPTENVEKIHIGNVPKGSTHPARV